MRTLTGNSSSPLLSSMLPPTNCLRVTQSLFNVHLFYLCLFIVITKEINDDNLSLTIKYPEDIESKEYHIGDDISLVCTLTNNLPIEFSIQSIEVVFSTADGSKSFTMRNDEGSSVDVVARGTNSDFVVRTVTEFHGVYKFASFSFVIGNLKLVYNSKNEPSENEKDKLITIVPVMPTAEIIAKFPSKTQQSRISNIIIRNHFLM